MNTTLKNIYYNPEKGFSNASTIQSRLTPSQRMKISLEQIEEFITNQETTQLHKPLPTGSRRRYFPIEGPPGTYQCDLTFYEQYKSSNQQYYIILTCIEVNSRYGYAIAMKNKQSSTILDAFDRIYE